MKTIWFKKCGWCYVPVHPAGFLVTVMALIFLVPVCRSLIGNGDSVSDDLYHMFVYTSCTAFWWKWIAEKTST
ncbi:MAG: hypothetical protein ACXVKI_15140 [Flavisolibacter sp.]